MIAVTVVSPSYAKVAREAIRRIKHFTGLEVKVIKCKDDEGFRTKLELHEHVSGSFLFFDADLWLLQPWNVLDYESSTCIHGCHDSAVFNPHAFPHTDCTFHGLDTWKYLNTGLIIGNFDLTEHQQAWREALQTYQMGVKSEDVSDQYHLNLAFLKHVHISFLPRQFNFYIKSVWWGQEPDYPADIFGLHAAGYPANEKYETLIQQAKIFQPRNYQGLVTEDLPLMIQAQHFKRYKL